MELCIMRHLQSTKSSINLDSDGIPTAVLLFHNITTAQMLLCLQPAYLAHTLDPKLAVAQFN